MRGAQVSEKTRMQRLLLLVASRMGRVRPMDWAALSVFVAAFVYRLCLIARGWPALDSDEAIIGLMARHILQGQYPVFYWSQAYMGAGQAYLAAVFFWLFGPSTFWLHFTVLLLTMGFLATLYALARAAYDRTVGLLTLLWLAFGPTMGVLRELKAIGGYQDVLLLGGLTLLGVWMRLRQPDRLPATRRAWLACLEMYLLIGLAAGIGLWSDVLILPVIALAFGVLAINRTRELLSIAGLALILGFLLGAAPLIGYNIVYPNATYQQVASQNREPGGGLPTPAEWLAQTNGAMAVSLPAILGSPLVCVTHGPLWSDYPPSMARSLNPHTLRTPQDEACLTANYMLSLGALALYAIAAWGLLIALRGWLIGWLARRRRTSHRFLSSHFGKGGGGIGESPVGLATMKVVGKLRADEHTENAAEWQEEHARLWLRAMLLGTGALSILAYTLSAQAAINQFTAARYLLLVYLSVPALFGVLWAGAAPLVRWLGGLLARSGIHFAIHSRSRWLRLSSSMREAPGEEDTPLPGKASRLSQPVLGALSMLALLLLLALSVNGGRQTLGYANNASQFALPMPPVDRQLVTFLDAHHITAFYGDYWTCYRLTFETNERLLCAARGGRPDRGLQLLYNRSPQYVSEMARVAHPAYILAPGSQQDRHFAADARAASVPYVGYRRQVIGQYAVYYYAP